MSDRLNRYTCQNCGAQFITIDRDHGTTPFMVGCRGEGGCGQGMAYSSFYRDVTGTPTFEWRKATPAEYALASAAMRQHFDMGGLDIHEIKS